MLFKEYETQVEAGGRIIPARITGAALHGLWGADVGPQTPHELFADNRALFEEVIADKLEAGDVSDGVIVITDADLDF